MTQNEILKRNRELKKEIDVLQKTYDRLCREEKKVMDRLEEKMRRKIAPVVEKLLKLKEKRGGLWRGICKNNLHFLYSRLPLYKRVHVKCPDCGYERSPASDYSDEAHP